MQDSCHGVIMLSLQIEVLHRRHEPLPTGWAVNKDGKVRRMHICPSQTQKFQP